MPVLLDQITNEWKFQGIDLSKNYVSKEEQNQLEVQECPHDIRKMMSNKKHMYFMLT